MRSKLSYALLLALFFTSVWFYVDWQKSALNTDSIEETGSNLAISEDEQQDTILTIWSPFQILDQEIEKYELENPNVKIEFTNLENEPRLVERYLNALADGTAPDLIVVPQRILGSFNSIDKLADLSKSPFHLPDSFREELGNYLWSIHQSLDAERLIAVPFDFYPNVLYYRADLLKEAGFPDDPEELAVFMDHPNHLIDIAHTLSKEGIYIFQWSKDPLDMVGSGRFFFDRTLTYQRMDDSSIMAVETSLQADSLNADVSMWAEGGRLLLEQDKIAMVSLPSWGEDVIKSWLPEQSGKWRATRLPFGAMGIDLQSSKSFAVSMNSKNKERAADFLLFVLNESGSLNWHRRKGPTPFLDNQDSAALYRRLILEQPADTVPTPLDETAFQIWNSSMNTALEKGITTEQAIMGAKQEIMDVVSVPLQQLSEYISRSYQNTEP